MSDAADLEHDAQQARTTAATIAARPILKHGTPEFSAAKKSDRVAAREEAEALYQEAATDLQEAAKLHAADGAKQDHIDAALDYEKAAKDWKARAELNLDGLRDGEPAGGEKVEYRSSMQHAIHAFRLAAVQWDAAAEKGAADLARGYAQGVKDDYDNGANDWDGTALDTGHEGWTLSLSTDGSPTHH
jgi:hypothetical protein